MTVSKNRFFYGLLILLPVIDLFTSLSTRLLSTNISLGMIIKSAIIVYCIIYIFFMTSSKFKKQSMIFLSFFMIFVSLYFIFKPDIFPNHFFVELSYIVKLMFFPILFSGLICYCEDNELDKKMLKYTFILDLLLYSLFLLIPLITGTAYNTYIDGSKGYVGWFYSGNEISAIIVLLLPFVYELLKDKKVIFFIILIITTLIFATIGTKVILFGCLIISLLVLLTSIFKKGLNDRKKTVFVSAISLIIVTIIMLNSASKYNFNHVSNRPSNDAIINIEEKIENDTIAKLVGFSLKLLSSRELYLIDTHSVYMDNFSVNSLLFGMGFSNTGNIDDVRILKLIEVDLLDIFYHAGIFGLVIVLLPYVYTLYLLIKAFIIKQTKWNSHIFFYGMMTLMSGGISCISGHVLLAPSVSILILPYLLLILDEANYFKKNKKNSKKVQILTLHLGFGGAERASVDLANMLTEKYEVEILSLYKTVDKCPFKINKNVTVNYLTSFKPNRNEFLSELKKIHLFNTLREGFKSIYILYLKHHLIKKTIQYSDAATIISSRIAFTKLLNNHGQNKVKKIAIEHNYNIDNQFIKLLKRYTKNIDVLVPVSKHASEIYKNRIPNLNVLHIPNIVSSEYSSKSSLKSKKLISVGRLEPEKGSTALIELMKILNSKDPSIELNIFGDGSLKNQMIEMIKDYELKNVKIHGFKTANEIEDTYKKSSLFVLTSYKESFGIVLIEAMKCGIPAIAFEDATGAKDIIKNEKNGFLISERNIEEMSTKIIEYLSYKDGKLIEMQKNALETAKQFSAEKIKVKWFDLLKKKKC